MTAPNFHLCLITLTSMSDPVMDHYGHRQGWSWIRARHGIGCVPSRGVFLTFITEGAVPLRLGENPFRTLSSKMAPILDL